MNIDSLMILVRYVGDLLITSYLNSPIVVVKGILHDTFFNDGHASTPLISIKII
jgi:hypothetical protein